MKVVLEIDPDKFEGLMSHLLQQGQHREEAAFLFTRQIETSEEQRFRVDEVAFLSGPDFLQQQPDYLELSDATRGRLIKRAHDLGASLVEIHSHVGPWRAAFSYSDVRGLKETVPNLWWRLKRRPYLAIVVSSVGFDALAWIESPDMPVPLDEIRVGERTIRPTYSALEEWQ